MYPMSTPTNPVRTPITAGATCSDFWLKDVRGGEVSLYKTLQEKQVLLVFYRGGWCPLCSRQLGELSEAWSQFQERSVQILAVSNEEPEKGRKLLKKMGPPFPLLADTIGSAITAFDLTVEKRDPLGWMLQKEDFAQPAVFLIGQDKVVKWAYRGKNYRDRPHPSAIVEAIDLLHASREDTKGDMAL